MPSKEKFPDIPQFYGGQASGSTGQSISNRDQWARAHEQAVGSTKQPFEYLLEVLNDPRNAWMGLGPMAGAVKGARLIKPLVEAAPLSPYANLNIPARAKSLKQSGSEGAAKILDYDPQLGHTTNPVWGNAGQTAEQFTPHVQGAPVTPDEIVAAQDLLKRVAQQNAPPVMTLYRGGEPVRHAHLNPTVPLPANTPVPASSSLQTATDFAQGGQPLFELRVPREDLLANIEKLQRGRGYKESEYLIPLRAFQGAQTRLPFENPSSVHQLKGAQVSPLPQPEQLIQHHALNYSNGPGKLIPHANGAYTLDIPGLQMQTYNTLKEAIDAQKGAGILLGWKP